MRQRAHAHCKRVSGDLGGGVTSPSRGRIGRRVGLVVCAAIVLSFGFLVAPPWVWLLGSVLGGLGSLSWLAVLCLRYSYRQVPRAVILTIVVGCCCLQPVVTWRGVRVPVGAVKGHQVDAQGLHLTWLGGIVPVVFRLSDWGGYTFLAQDANPSNVLSVPSVTAAVLFSPGATVDASCGPCTLLGAGSHRPDDYALVSGGGSYWIVRVGTGSAWRVEPTAGFAIMWVFWGIAGLLLACLARVARSERRARTGRDGMAAAG